MSDLIIDLAYLYFLSVIKEKKVILVVHQDGRISREGEGRVRQTSLSNQLMQTGTSKSGGCCFC